MFEWVEWRSVLQLLPVIDFDAMRDMISHLIAKIPISILWVIIPAYTESPYLNPMGVVTENARSLPQPLLAIADLILNIFLQYKWISHSLIIDGIVNIMGIIRTFPCQMPHALYIIGRQELVNYTLQLVNCTQLVTLMDSQLLVSYINQQTTISELYSIPEIVKYIQLVKILSCDLQSQSYEVIFASN